MDSEKIIRKRKLKSSSVRPNKSEPVDLFSISIDQKLMTLIPKSFAKRYHIFPLKRTKAGLVIAMENTKDYATLNELRMMTGLPILAKAANRMDIQQLIVREYPSDINIDGLADSHPQLTEETDSDPSDDSDSPIIQLVKSLLQEAIDRRTSDIHFDPQERYLAVRIRVDGEMRELKRLPKNVQAAVISRLKILSSLDITETRLPQDGRAMLKEADKVVDLRVSVLPTIHGEKIVIRILDRSVGIRRLDTMGFEPKTLANLQGLLKKPHGIILVTGPTGSGKSSTLYGALQDLNNPDVNIITVEDPVEYQLEGVNQVLVNSSIGLTFASGLRSILRQDPNIIMVGEIRDKETAEIAIRASMTGHLVLSTLHTNDSVSTINRLIDMEVDPFLVANSLEGVLAQRLVRRICSNCRATVSPSAKEQVFLAEYGIHPEHVYQGKGCSKCEGTGYRGRLAIHELLVVTSELRTMIGHQASNDDLAEYVSQQGMDFLIHDGIKKVMQGDTTIEEVIKVVADES